MTVEEGKLLLGVRIELGYPLLSQQEVEKDGHKAYRANDHAIARKGSEMRFYFDRHVPLDVTRRLMFVQKHKEPVGLVFKHKTNELDQQTLRRVREITPESAQLLDAFLRKPWKSLQK